MTRGYDDGYVSNDRWSQDEERRAGCTTRMCGAAGTGVLNQTQFVRTAPKRPAAKLPKPGDYKGVLGTIPT